VGHYGCAGVAAALAGRRVGLADNWLRHIQDLRLKHSVLLEVFPDDQRADRLCELNVIEQVVNVAQTTIVQDAWDRGQPVAVHGWTYAVGDGLVRAPHITISCAADIRPNFDRAILKLGGR